ncbi:SdpI family protein [Corynebacterium tapiri]|uniref:SdpI family protein n=1 Tax=Corynebacterium tapiri TaxID=1448266 RepID=A0A5C4U3B0_9CORY|nr:SdpI family protein [Corynebacterium tapiri]TNL96883.1 SdpI family protein [Corynebacterium tapiri]
MIAVALVLGVLGLALAVISGLALLKKLPGNPIVGIRVAEVRKSREIWDAAHHVAGAAWMVGAVALLIGALVASRAEGWLWLIPVAMVIVALIALGAGANLGARLAASIDVAQEVEAAQAPAPAPKAQVNLDAVRKAARDQK